MAILKKVERTVATGKYGSVEFAVDPPDEMAEAWTWKEKLPPNKWRSFLVLMKRLLDEGVIHNHEQFKLLTNNVCEFKRNGNRLLCYRHGKRYLLTNTLKKSGRKNINSDIERAEAIGKGHIEWEASPRALNQQ